MAENRSARPNSRRARNSTTISAKSCGCVCIACRSSCAEAEQRAFDLFLQNLVKGTSHLSLGQEAIAAASPPP